MSPGRKFGITIGAVLVLTLVVGFLVLKPMYEQNEQKKKDLVSKEEELKQLRPLVGKLADLERGIEQLKQQLERRKTVVPDEKQADQFMHVLQEQASAANIEIRRYTAKPVATRDFYSEVPFEIDIDGTYDGVVTFFDKVAHLERIINIGNLQMATPARQTDAKTKKKYIYAPGESVVASCTATTFFSRSPEAARAAAPAPVKK